MDEEQHKGLEDLEPTRTGKGGMYKTPDLVKALCYKPKGGGFYSR
jgi:hypothetical protein